MTSFKSKTVNFLIRHTHILRGQLRKETFDMNTSIEGFRERCERGASRYATLPEGIKIIPFTISGMNAEWLVPDGAPPDKVILYVHGGGYVAGSCNDHRSIISKFAKQAGVRCLLYEYRLAPEHPYPAAVDDSVAAFRWLIGEGYTPENILTAGESAGGGLVLALLLALKYREIPMPVATVAISPWTDLTCSGESYHTKNRRSPAPLNSWFVFSKHYCGGHPSDLPFISPLFGDLEGLPPLLINSAEDDELFDDGRRFAQKAQKAGVDAFFRPGTGMVHCYPLLAPMFPEATEALKEITQFIRKHLKIG